MKTKVRYPYSPAIALAHGLSGRLRKKFPHLFGVSIPPTFNDLKRLTKNNNVVLVEDQRIPTNREAVLMDVEGMNYILLHKKLRRNKEDRSFYLGHELGHVLLKHQNVFVGNLLPYLEDPYTKDEALQVLYENEKEMEANFFSMMLIAPDPFLDAIVEKKVYISAFNLSDSIEINLSLAVARIELYRSMYGYENSYRAAARKKRVMDEVKVLSQELPSNSRGLEHYLPQISTQLLPFIK